MARIGSELKKVGKVALVILSSRKCVTATPVAFEFPPPLPSPYCRRSMFRSARSMVVRSDFRSLGRAAVTEACSTG
jgi:hypothetical protein